MPGERPLLSAFQVERYVGSICRSRHSFVVLFLLLSHLVLRTHNLTVLPSHNSTFVRTNDSAYSNFSATVGEHLYTSVPCSVEFGSAMSLEASLI